MRLNAFVFCFVTLFCADLMSIMEALKPGNNGVCVVKISTRKTRTKMVTTNKKCGKKKCVVKKLETYTVPEQRVVCCNGFMYNVETDVCSPICSTGCIGGRCVAPETCDCDLPAVINPKQKNACILPTCDPPCVNAQCWEHNTCRCNPDHTTFNSTHCFKCDPGYNISKDFICTPACDTECVNGYCSAPNTCTCKEGYESMNNTCEPICESCINSTCIAPNKCSCLEGYKQINETTCVPGCEKCEGDCVAPNVCICKSGFEEVSGACKPICERCEHGTCTAPGECTCDGGYDKNASDPMSCVRNCDRPTEVETSSPKISYLRVRARRCPSGTKECKPNERRNLPHFKPSKEERCCVKKYIAHEKRLLCCEGYEYVNDSCKSLCGSDCVNGKCLKSLVYNNHTCQCNPGYTTFNSSHCAIECAAGFTNDPITLECIPKCDSPCLNGNCTAPNTCTCNTGYAYKDNFTCVPECIPSCSNAECTAPNTCSCFDIYIPDNITHCSPFCSEPCSNGICSAPNFCQCHAGYELDPSNHFNCKAICEPNCVNATCVSPNTCSCLNGYEITGSHWICQPKCIECEHGECIEPNVCSCHNGYSKKDGKCIPNCERPCSNGVCSAPDTCTCNDGYEPDIDDKFSCKPKCLQPCVNSTCTSPDKCTCWDDYESTDDENVCKPKCKSCDHGVCVAPDMCVCENGYNMTKGNCSPVCSVPCVNGYCSSPNTCTCFEGYEKNSPTGSICSKPCDTPCNHGICSLHGICKCDSGYQFMNNTCSPIQSVDCASCSFNCTELGCWCSDGVQCYQDAELVPEVASSTTGLAGLELTWTLAGAIGLLLLVLVVTIMHRLYRKRKACESKDIGTGDRYGSVVYNYTVPDTLVRQETDVPNDDDDEEKHTNDRLITPQLVISDEKL